MERRDRFNRNDGHRDRFQRREYSGDRARFDRGDRGERFDREDNSDRGDNYASDGASSEEYKNYPDADKKKKRYCYSWRNNCFRF